MESTSDAEMVPTKACIKCGKILRSTSRFFVPGKTEQNNGTGTCRPCYAAYMRVWREGHREEINAKARADYAERYGAISRANVRRRKDIAPLRRRAEVLRSGMRERSKELDLPFDADILTADYLMAWILRTPLCPCCGRAIDYSFKHDGVKHDDSPSVDRIDPLGGYTLANVALICWRCNNLKRDATADELQRVVDWMRNPARQRVSDIRPRVDLRGGNATETAKRTHCVHGHEFNAENTRMYRGHRSCRTCHTAYTREWRRRQVDGMGDERDKFTPLLAPLREAQHG